MKIVIERSQSPHDRVSWESPTDDLSVDELVMQIKGLLVAFGYHPKSVDDHFPEPLEWWDSQEEQSSHAAPG